MMATMIATDVSLTPLRASTVAAFASSPDWRAFQGEIRAASDRLREFSLLFGHLDQLRDCTRQLGEVTVVPGRGLMRVLEVPGRAEPQSPHGTIRRLAPECACWKGTGQRYGPVPP